MRRGSWCALLGWRGMVLLASVAAQRVRDPPPASDPLAQWLYDLKFNLQDVTQEKAGITFHVTELVCQNLQLTDIQSAVQGVGLSVTLDGIGIQCAGHFAYNGYKVVSGSGVLTATVSSNSASSASVVLQGSSFEKNLPWAVDAASCSASLAFKLTLRGSIIDWIINLFSAPVSALIERLAVRQACDKLKQLAAGPLTQKLAAFNHLMLPPGFGSGPHVAPQSQPAGSEGDEGSAKGANALQVTVGGLAVAALGPLEAMPEGKPIPASWVERRLFQTAGNAGTVDWTQDHLLHWVSWLLDDVLGPQRLDQALRWASKGLPTTIPGPAKPVMTTTIQQPDAGLELKLEVFLVQAVIEGADGMSTFSPVQAVGPDQLRFKVGWGAALGLGVEMKVNLEAVSLATGKPQASVLQQMKLHIGLQQPSLDVTSAVLVLADQWPGRHTLAQFVLEPRQCVTSIFQSAPRVVSLEAEFVGLATPLSFEAQTTGALEASISALLNNVVSLFNQVYEPLLPAAIQRAAGSSVLLAKLNEALKAQMKPGGCIDASMASQKIRAMVPQNYSNWPPVFDNVFRSWLDNFLDGFLAQNTSVLDQGLPDMPSLKLPLNAAVKLKQLLAEGMDQVQTLRVLVPSQAHPSWLGMSAAVKCPTAQSGWRPALGVNASLVAGDFRGDGVASFIVPCGAADMEVDVMLDLWSLLDLQLPSSAACALLAPLARFDVKEVNATWDSGGDVQVRPSGGLPEEPLKELCEMHPRLCRLAAQVRERISRTQDVERLYQRAREAALKQCKSEALHASQDVNRDSLGYRYVPASSLQLWALSAFAVLMLSLTATFCAHFGQLLHQDGCAQRSPTAALPLASICWFGVRDWPTAWCKAGTVAVSLLISVSLVSRALCSFWLPAASAGLDVTRGSSGSIFKDDTLLLYTFFGSGVQFGLGGSLYCEILWFLMSLGGASICLTILILVWMTPFFAQHRRRLLLVALVLGRLPLSEIETSSNTMLVLGNEVPLPLGLSQSMGLFLQAGAYVSWISSISSLLAILLLLQLLPREVKENDWAYQGPPKVVALQGFAAALMVAGICVWWFCDYLHAVTGGLAGALIDPASYSASQLGKSDAALRTMIILMTIICPLGHVAAFALALSGKAPRAARAVAGFSATFCLLDIFALGYLISFLEGVGGFASSAIHGLAPRICDLSQDSLGEACLTLQAQVVPLGTAGLLVATAAWTVLFSIQVLGAGQGARREVPPAVP